MRGPAVPRCDPRRQSEPRHRPDRPTETSRCATGCGPACGTARCRRCRYGAEQQRRRQRRLCRRSRWFRRPAIGRTGRQRTASRSRTFSAHRYRRLDESVVRSTAKVSPPLPSSQSSCSASRNSVATAGVLYVWSLRELPTAIDEVEKGGNVPAAGRDPLDPGERARRHRPRSTAHRRRRSTSAARSSRHRPGSGPTAARRPTGRVDHHQCVWIRPIDPAHRSHDAGRGLVVRPCVDVDAGFGTRVASVPGAALTTVGSSSHGADRTAAANFAENSPNSRCWARSADQPECGRVPERRRAAVAEHDLVTIGRCRTTRPRPSRTLTDQPPDRRLPVGGAEVGRAGRRQRCDCLGADLARSRAEPPVAGKEVSGGSGMRHEEARPNQRPDGAQAGFHPGISSGRRAGGPVYFADGRTSRPYFFCSRM